MAFAVDEGEEFGVGVEPALFGAVDPFREEGSLGLALLELLFDPGEFHAAGGGGSLGV